MLFLGLWTCALAALPTAQAPSPCDAVASLEHSAPWVGGDLVLTLEGAPPGASVRLFHSPAAGQTPTPYGLLELDRAQLDLAAGGQADAQGHWEVALAIPLDPLLVEAESHYQALVQDPVGAGALSAAVHLRTLGPRSYTLCAGGGSAPPSLDVHAITDGAPVASVALAAWPPTSCPLEGLWRPVFSGNLARGAFLSHCGELVVIDNFDATVVAVLAVESASPRLLPSKDGRFAYVLERPSGAAPHIRALELASATFVATLDLPATCGALWSLEEGTQMAFVQDMDPGSGELLARRVDLAAWQVLDALLLRSGPNASMGWLDVRSGWLYAGTNHGSWGNHFAAIDLHSPSGNASVITFYVDHPKPPVVVPSVERLFLGVSNGIGPSPDDVFVAPVDQLQRLVEFPAPSYFPFMFGPSVVRDDHLWMLSRTFDTDYPVRLWNLDALALSWGVTAESWYYPWPATLLAARGPLVDVLLMPRTGLRSPFANFDPALIVLDGSSGAIVDSWPLSWGAVAGYVLEP